ncbi:RluA family pseudouridine synthase [Acetobacterium sp. K1/6]|uniref:RluA family pseudouridine synthase n=1 Tax=Acetobacterium sp. K1/6 TaxID=3055467 RepID=UPI002ACAE609|nr:RluA family pseudouridine synthase [Acetobacterium sp. K1/6]MDZ5723833.1 RluA family pseudouridine synthase [Acetobacterium sp. K1/6]
MVKRYSYSSRLIREIKRIGKISLNQRECFLGQQIKPGDVIEIKMPCEDIDGEPVSGNLNVVYEDEELLVINKPPFCVTHPTKTHQLDTLANYISYYWSERGVSAKIRFINRLDRDTTGIVAIAKNKYVHHYVQKETNSGKVIKVYHAFVHGKLPHQEGIINAPIGQPYENSIHRVVMEDGKPSVTRYKVLDEFKDASLVELVLETGRTHQIRVHMKHLGNPIIGDPLYHGECMQTGSFEMPHQALHAHRLLLSLPSKKNLHVQAEYSKNLTELHKHLRENKEKKVME